jgi:hypothetical protein
MAGLENLHCGLGGGDMLWCEWGKVHGLKYFLIYEFDQNVPLKCLIKVTSI